MAYARVARVAVYNIKLEPEIKSMACHIMQ